MIEDDEMRRRLELWRAWGDEIKARRWLADNARRAEFHKLSDDEILDALSDISSRADRVAFLDVLCERVEQRPDRFQARVAEVLARLAERHPGPGRDAVAVDHAIQRTLHRLTGMRGRSLALASLRSNRKPRRAAAWKFYRRHGLDDSSRDLIERHFAQDQHDEVSKIVSEDADLVVRLGPDAVLEVAPNRYWRMKVLVTVIEHRQAAEPRLRKLYPAEWLWAVAQRSDRSRLPVVLRMLEINEDAPDLVNRILLCVSKLGDRGAIEQTLEAAQRILATPEPDEPME